MDKWHSRFKMLLLWPY